MENCNIGTTFWITGLSGAGKTTIGQLFFNYLKKKKNNIVFLDGDVLRQVYESNDFSQSGRKKLAYQHSRLCNMLNKQELDVVICVIAMYEDCRKWNRENILNYREIYLKVSIEELIRRDQKKLYSRALRNEIQNVMGINLEFEEPKNPDIVVNNSGILPPEDIVDIIIEKLLKK